MSVQNIEAAYPLSPLQQGMLFHSLGAPGSAVYVMQTRCELHGDVDAHVLYQAWQHVLDRHQALRAAFVWEDVDEPLQLVGRRVRMPFSEQDWRGVAPAVQRARFEAWTRRDRRAGFVLSRAPLMRLALARFDDRRYELVWTYHHAVCDGWSRPVLLGELWRCYDAFRERRPAALPPAVRYHDYIARLPRDLAAAEAFWREQLREVTHPTPLGVDRPAASPLAPHGHGRAELRLSAEETREVDAAARRHAVSIATIIAAAWAVVLSRYSGESTVLFGLTVSGRSLPLDGIESLVGVCINTLPLRVRVPPSMPVAGWLRALHRHHAALRDYEHTPLARLQQWTRLAPGTPLFDSIVVVENVPAEVAFVPPANGSGRFGIGRVSAVEKTNYALTLVAAPGPALTLAASYDPARFEADTIDRLLGHLAAVMRGLASAGPRATVDGLSLHAPAERAALQEAAAHRPHVGADVACLHDRWTRQARLRPEAIAVTFGETSTSYGALAARVRQLADRLRAAGVAPDVRVALWMERSVDLVVAILGVIDAGGAYVPVDPSSPPDRLAFILQDADARLIVTHAAAIASLPSAGVPVVAVDELEATGSRDGHGEAGGRRASPDNLAYIIYTSGSSGQPKGVQVTHRNVGRLLDATEGWFRFDSADTWTLVHSCAFDFSVWELWGALTTGGRLIVVPYITTRSPRLFAELIEREQVTVLNQTPSAFTGVAACLLSADGAARALRTVIFGGEALDVSALRPWLERYGDERPRLINMYGITETTVHVTYHHVRRGEPPAGTIGVPIPDLDLHVLDASLQPAPVGVPGELCVGGPGLARGYWRRPALTAERFVPDPFSRQPGARLYRSGDIGRRRAEGGIEYVGRRDTQVKLRGHRIELGEIESALRQQAGVREAVVLLREDRPGDRRLVAYVVPSAAGAAPAPDALHAQLRARLPEYMVPAVFVVLDALPLTVHGKADRRNLPSPAAERPAMAQPFTAPRTALESALARIWAEVLRLDRIGIDDNFFTLGGDSIRIVQVQAKSRERGISVSIEQLMRHQTIRDLAPHLGDAAPAVRRTTAFELVSADDRARLPADAEDAYPLTELQAGMLFHSELGGGAAVYHDVLSVHLRVPWDPAAFEAALDDVMAAHPILRATIHMTGYAEPLQIVHRRCAPPFRADDLRDCPAGEREAWLSAWLDAEARARFDWTAAPLFRCHLHRRTDDSLQCTLIIHHAIADGWSVATLGSDLFLSFLARLGEATAPRVRPPVLAFRDYVALERAAVRNEEHAEYWTRHVASGSPTLVPRLPVDAPARERRGPEPRAAVLPSAVVTGLRQAAERAGVPLKTVLLAGHLRVLALVANQADVVTGVVMHGRTGDADSDRVVGLFLNTVPLRCRIEGSWIDLARRVFAVECEHTRRLHYPMPALQRRRGAALFDAAFNYVHFHAYDALAGIPRLRVLGGSSRVETNIPLLLQCALQAPANEVQLRLDADRSQFPDDDLDRLLAYHVRAYAELARDPDGPCLAADVIPAVERDTTTRAWNATTTAHRLDLGVHELIAAQAERTPGNVAVASLDGTATYATLVGEASRLAGLLHRHGVGPDVCVGICLPRSLDMAVAVLATLHAGGAYVPLDPAYPAERLRMMIDDAAPRVLLTTTALRERLGAVPCLAICLDEDEWRDAAAAPVRHVDPAQLAYVMYTSGSTGRPKGIGLPHLALTNLIQWHLRRLGGGMRTLQFASLGFDASFHEMAAAWCSGGTLYLTPDAVRADSRGLACYIRDHAVEKAILPVVVLQQMAEHCSREPELFASLRQVITTGEQMRLTRAVTDLIAALPACTLHNHYGPAETHVVTSLELSGDPARWPVHPPIGRPIDNTQIHLLGRDGRPVPIGTPGELYIGGVSLARGYIGRPDLTAPRFVPDAIGGEGGARLYRTGDLARWLPGGDIEFLGRMDHQVKIRGQRVELGEVEAAIVRCPTVRDAVVLAHDAASNDTRLLAYVIPSGGSELTVGELRAFLARTLPDVMIPSAFVTLDAFPLTANGKLDRGRLPVPDTRARPALSAPFVAPRTPAERLVAGIFERVLGVESVGVHDHFFERGGHSLLATRAIVRLREAFGTDLPLRLLFEQPTAAGLAAGLAGLLGGGAVADGIAAAVLEVDGLSDAEVSARLAAERARDGRPAASTLA